MRYIKHMPCMLEILNHYTPFMLLLASRHSCINYLYGGWFNATQYYELQHTFVDSSSYYTDVTIHEQTLTSVPFVQITICCHKSLHTTGFRHSHQLPDGALVTVEWCHDQSTECGSWEHSVMDIGCTDIYVSGSYMSFINLYHIV